jgi:hypothetical protein
MPSTRSPTSRFTSGVTLKTLQMTQAQSLSHPLPLPIPTMTTRKKIPTMTKRKKTRMISPNLDLLR